MKLWIATTRDKYRLPIAVCDTVQELSKKCGVKVSTIYRSDWLAKTTGVDHAYMCVEVEDD